jgi:hypothetical protein
MYKELADTKAAINVISGIALALFSSCTAPRAISTIESDFYEAKTNKTTFTKLPFGSISMPGKWTKVSYNAVSKQHNFKNADSILTAVAINRASSYPFYKAGMSSNELVKALYEWDSQYLAEKTRGSRSIVLQDTVEQYIIWQIIGKYDKFDIDNHYLFGSENGIIFTVFIGTAKWTNEQKIDYLRSVYKSKTVGTCCE